MSMNLLWHAASSDTSRLEAHDGFFRLLMKGIFDPYVLWHADVLYGWSLSKKNLPKDARFYPVLVKVVAGHVKGLQFCQIGKDIKVNGCQGVIVQNQRLQIRRWGENSGWYGCQSIIGQVNGLEIGQALKRWLHQDVYGVVREVDVLEWCKGGQCLGGDCD